MPVDSPDAVNWPYVFVVGLGALTLAIEAYRQFSTPIKGDAHVRYPILQGMSLDSLCTRAELVRGFVFYVLSYLLAYGVILGFTELQAVVTTTGETTLGPTGPIALSSGEVLADVDYGTPLIISASIIAAMSTGASAPIEQAIRSFSHRLANIPRGVYRLLTRLHRVDYAAIGARHYLQRSKRFSDIVASDSRHPASDLTHEAADALKTIDLLAPSVTGDFGKRIFAAHPFATLHAMIERQKEELAALDEALEALADQPEQMQSFHEQTLVTRNNVLALFAVLYIRNGRRIAAVSDKNPTVQIVEAIENERDPIMHAMTGAALAAAVLTLPMTIAVYRLMSEGLPDDWMGIVAEKGLWNGLLAGLTFWVAGGSAALIRERRLERDRWRPWTLRRIPFLRFAALAIFPALTAGLVCAFVALLQKVVAAGGLTTSQAYDYVRDSLPFCLMSTGFGALTAICVFGVIDKHEALRAVQTVAIAVLIGALYTGWAFTTAALTYNSAALLRDTLLLAAPGVVFFVLFAVLLEIAEDPAHGRLRAPAPAGRLAESG